LDRLDALKQNFDAERLGDVIIGAEREADDLIHLFRLGAQDDNRDVARLSPARSSRQTSRPGKNRQHRSRIMRSGNSV